MLKADGAIARFAEFPFRHGAAYELPGTLPRLFLSYHPSQQNTFTGKLTPGMLLNVLRAIRKYLDRPATKTPASRNS
jgi:uracil-DNA glycosylase